MNIKKSIKNFIPDFLLSFYHYILALMGTFLFGFPSGKIIVIGITGTSGKTTTADLTAGILEEAGFKTALLSSVKFKIAEKEWENRLKMTMPGRFAVQKFLRQAVKANCKYAVLEVTSEGIKQYRHKFIRFDTAVFTNLSPEHIEAHKSFKNYKRAKSELFKVAKNIHIINFDDKNRDYFLKIPAKRKMAFSLERVDNKNFKIIAARNIKETFSGAKFKIQDTDFNLNLFGRFNVYNALAAICVGLSQGISLEICKRALEKAKVIPGRMEIVIKEPFLVVVDYAITPFALEKVYQTTKKIFSRKPENKLICVLGACGGGRDKWKRPVLGKIAGKHCNEVIITNEDPYEENPEEIIKQVARGAGEKAEKIADRREAIKEALKRAKPNDIVVITGKGCEPWMCVAGGRKIPWDDRKTVKEEFEKIKT